MTMQHMSIQQLRDLIEYKRSQNMSIVAEEEELALRAKPGSGAGAGTMNQAGSNKAGWVRHNVGSDVAKGFAEAPEEGFGRVPLEEGQYEAYCTTPEGREPVNSEGDLIPDTLVYEFRTLNRKGEGFCNGAIWIQLRDSNQRKNNRFAWKQLLYAMNIPYEVVGDVVYHAPIPGDTVYITDWRSVTTRGGQSQIRLQAAWAQSKGPTGVIG